MTKRIILYTYTENYNRVIVRYNPISDSVTISTIKIKNGSQYQKEYYKKHHNTIQKRHKQYRNNNRDILRERGKKHYNDNKDYYRKKKSQRDRKLNFIKLVENDWAEPVDWHHVDNTHVVPIPRYLHKMCYTGDREKHRQLCNKLIKLLYGDTINGML